MSYKLYNGDCLEIMREMDAESVDCVITDPPYGTTRCKWDAVIPLGEMWECVNKMTEGHQILFAGQPFSSALVASNFNGFRYEWVWVKTKITGVLNAKKMPVRKHEQILVFGNGRTYNPQGLAVKGTITKQGGSSQNYNARPTADYVQEFTNYPRDVLEFASEGKTQHPTQKPVDLMRYLIRTYTNEGDTVLDFTMGSGTTGVACLLEGRNFIGIEKDEKYFEIAEARIKNALSTDLTVTNNSDNGSEETDCETKADKRHSPQTALPFLNGD